MSAAPPSSPKSSSPKPSSSKPSSPIPSSPKPSSSKPSSPKPSSSKPSSPKPSSPKPSCPSSPKPPCPLSPKLSCPFSPKPPPPFSPPPAPVEPPTPPRRRLPATVHLNIYDLVTPSYPNLISRVNDHLLPLGLGLFHSGVAIIFPDAYAVEYSFGATDDFRSGIFACAPRRAPQGRFRTCIDVGETYWRRDEVERVVESLGRTRFIGGRYHVVYRNCNTFSEVLVEWLTGKSGRGAGGVPAWVNRVAVLSRLVGCVIPPEEELVGGDSRGKRDAEGMPETKEERERRRAAERVKRWSNYIHSIVNMEDRVRGVIYSGIAKPHKAARDATSFSSSDSWSSASRDLDDWYYD